jgi:hypothetical protein
LTRTIGRHCSFLDGRSERLIRTSKCGPTGQEKFFSIGSTSTFSYLLPIRLPPGRYVVDVQTVDRAGNVSMPGTRGQDRVVFTVT